MLTRMSSDRPLPPGATRMHARGKLSFRRRVPEVTETTAKGLPYIPPSDDPPQLSQLVPAGHASVEIEVGPVRHS